MILFNFILQDDNSDDDDDDDDTDIRPTKSKRLKLFGPAGASTGHSSSSDITWQNIESDDDEDHNIRPSKAKRQKLDGPLSATTSSALEDVMYQPKYLY